MAFRRYRPPLIKRAGFRWALRRLRSLNGQGNRPGGEVKYARRPFLPSKPLDGLLVPVLCELGPKTDRITEHKGAERPLIRSGAPAKGYAAAIGVRGGSDSRGERGPFAGLADSAPPPVKSEFPEPQDIT